MHTDPAADSHSAERKWLFELPGIRWDESDACQARQLLPDLDLDVLTAVSEEETWIYAPAQHRRTSDVSGEARMFLATMLGVDRDALPKFRHRSLDRLLSLGDVTAGRRQRWHYTSQTDIPEHVEDDFNRWFDEEHLPQLASVDGTVHAARYRTDGSPRYLASYDLQQREIQGGTAWRSAIATPWRDRIHKEFLMPRRLMLMRLG